VATPPQNPRRRTRPQLTAGSGNPNCSLLVLTLAAGMREACFPCGCLGHLVAVRLCLFRRTAPPMATPGLRTQEKKGRYSAALRVAFCICLTEQKDIRKSGYLANRVWEIRGSPSSGPRQGKRLAWSRLRGCPVKISPSASRTVPGSSLPCARSSISPEPHSRDQCSS